MTYNIQIQWIIWLSFLGLRFAHLDFRFGTGIAAPLLWAGWFEVRLIWFLSLSRARIGQFVLRFAMIFAVLLAIFATLAVSLRWLAVLPRVLAFLSRFPRRTERRSLALLRLSLRARRLGWGQLRSAVVVTRCLFVWRQFFSQGIREARALRLLASCVSWARRKECLATFSRVRTLECRRGTSLLAIAGGSFLSWSGNKQISFYQLKFCTIYCDEFGDWF